MTDRIANPWGEPTPFGQGEERRPHLEWPVDLGYRERVVQEGLLRVRLPFRDGGQQAQGVGYGDAGRRGAPEEAKPTTGTGAHPDLDRGWRRDRSVADRGRARPHLERVRRPARGGTKEQGPGRLVHEGRA